MPSATRLPLPSKCTTVYQPLNVRRPDGATAVQMLPHSSTDTDLPSAETVVSSPEAGSHPPHGGLVPSSGPTHPVVAPANGLLPLSPVTVAPAPSVVHVPRPYRSSFGLAAAWAGSAIPAKAAVASERLAMSERMCMGGSFGLCRVVLRSEPCG